METKLDVKVDMLYRLGLPVMKRVTLPDTVHSTITGRLHVMLRSLVCARLQLLSFIVGMEINPRTAENVQDKVVLASLLSQSSRLNRGNQKSREDYANTQVAALLAAFFTELAEEAADESD